MAAYRPLQHGIRAVMPSKRQLQHGITTVTRRDDRFNMASGREYMPNRWGVMEQGSRVMELNGGHMGRVGNTRPVSRMSRFTQIAGTFVLISLHLLQTAK
jgi:hypothetical protein